MDKLPDDQHAIMAHFSDLGHAKDITFVHPDEYGDGCAVDALERLGYLQPVDLHYGECWLTLLDKGRAYRIAFFPTKDEQIAQLRLDEMAATMRAGAYWEVLKEARDLLEQSGYEWTPPIQDVINRIDAVLGKKE